MEENNTATGANNIKLSDDPSVTLTIRLIMQGKVSAVFLVYLYFYII